MRVILDKSNKWKYFGTGALIGIMGSTISMLSKEIVNTPLGYSPMGVKNVVKVGVCTGVTTTGMMVQKDELSDVLPDLMIKILEAIQIKDS